MQESERDIVNRKIVIFAV